MSLSDLEENEKQKEPDISKNQEIFEKYKHVISKFLKKLEENDITEDVLECIVDEEDVRNLVMQFEENKVKQILLKKFLYEKFIVPKQQEKENNNNYTKKHSDDNNYRHERNGWMSMVQFLRYKKGIQNIEGYQWAETIDQLNDLAQIFLREKYHTHDTGVLREHIQRRKNRNPKLGDISIFNVKNNQDVLDHAFQVLKESKKKIPKRQKIENIANHDSFINHRTRYSMDLFRKKERNFFIKRNPYDKDNILEEWKNDENNECTNNDFLKEENI